MSQLLFFKALALIGGYLFVELKQSQNLQFTCTLFLTITGLGCFQTIWDVKSWKRIRGYCMY